MKNQKLYRADHKLGNCISSLSALFDARKYPADAEREKMIKELESSCLANLVVVKQTLQELLTEGDTQ